ncbi:hypothetical protein [Acinetobacter genomosp. 15BJ]|uniref:Ig-like domain-containing protein n=1 Tax=Acinetobacter genomosp. 15BJ TaxID=106651 RepID=R9B048_9GAMM|nr:hypothetical protein [Acinetobacter genomosp. 15BJ]EOR07813.1 hypothetical protein F896_02186 [Acinetobacter genomosp. 15BJ]MCH7291249.1 hypothetical protein [Acinetobacter genomosp. 15BJ]MDO3658003.1 hypothetical protein [Acinetobacter genomosp. 15BJ]
MKSLVYFIGGPKDGEIYNDKRIKIDDLIKIPKLEPSNPDSSETTEGEPVLFDEVTYKCEIFGCNGVKLLFLVDTSLEWYEVFEKVDGYFEE